MYPSLRLHRARALVCMGVMCDVWRRAARVQTTRIYRYSDVLPSVDLQREHRRVEHRASDGCVLGTRRFRPGAHRGGPRSAGRRRMRGRGARRRGRCARARVHAHVALCIRVYVDGPPMDAHLCSSAIELPLHPGLPMSNAHTHRPFPRSMHTCIRLCACIVCARACVCVRACVRACVFVYGGALNEYKLRKFVNILARVLYGCVKV